MSRPKYLTKDQADNLDKGKDVKSSQLERHKRTFRPSMVWDWNAKNQRFLYKNLDQN